MVKFLFFVKFNHTPAIRAPNPIFASLTTAGIANTDENYLTFREARDKPHLLDDETVDRAISLYTEQMEHVVCIDRQIAHWKKGTLSDNQKKDIEELVIQNKKLQELTEKTLFLVKELKKVTINRILEMDDAELALKTLLGEIKLPKL